MAPADTATSDKEELILEAALELFSERGFHGTAVPLVAERAGVGAGTIYRYFQDKEALVNALYQRSKMRILAYVLERVGPDLAPRDQFHAFFDAWVSFLRENPKVVLFLELHHHAPYLDAQSRAIEERATVLATATLEEAKRKKAIKDVPVPVLLAVLQGVMIGLARHHVEGRLKLDEATLEAAEQCVWEAIRR